MNDSDSNPFKDSPAEARAPVGETPSLVRFSEHEVQNSYLFEALPGIALAGGAYPFFLASIILFFAAIYAGNASDFVSGFSFLLYFSLVGGVIGMLVATVTGLFSIALLITVNRSLGYPLNARSAAISAGSLAGYATTVWILFIDELGSDYAAVAAVGILGPILAMTLGAIGAAWASSSYCDFGFSLATRPRKSRLSIMQMMIATAWIAVTFAIANLLGGLGFAIAVAGWFVLHGFLLGVIHLHRKLRKQSVG